MVLREGRRQLWYGLLADRQPLGPDQLAAAQPDQRAELETLQTLALGEEAGPPSPELRQALQAAGCGPSSGDIRRLLSDLGLWDAHRLPSLAGTTWSAGFSAELLELAAALAARSEETWPGDKERVDLTGLKTVTIDDADTREIDDALSLESNGEAGWRIWIHVADPGRLVAEGSPSIRRPCGGPAACIWPVAACRCSARPLGGPLQPAPGPTMRCLEFGRGAR